MIQNKTNNGYVHRKRISNPKSGAKPKANDVVARVVSLFAFVISVATFVVNYIAAGQLVIHQPTGFCIVRGYTDIGFSSDHLAIPFTIENTGKGVKTFQAPALRLKEKNGGKELLYKMTGTIPDLYRLTLDETYQIGFSVSIPEKSVREYYLVFHVENWWDENKPEYYTFHFQGGQEWDVSLSYLMNGKEVNWQQGTNETLFTMPIYETIDNLKYGGNYNADCFSTIYNAGDLGN
jgi:hypothetical protein